MGGKFLIERASWTLVDQGVLSFGNFLLNVLLARTVSQEHKSHFFSARPRARRAEPR